MNTETITRIEGEIMQLEKDRAKAEQANDAAIEAEENRKSGHTDIQAANVEKLKSKKDAVMQAFDRIRERKSQELALARTQKAVREADENAENEARASKVKESTRRTFIAAGGPAAEFETYFQQIVVAQTVAKMAQEKNRFVLPRI